MTLQEALDKNCKERPSKPFILYRDKVLTFEDVYKLSSGFADYLISRGIQKGDIISVLLPRVPELVLSFLGAIKIGGIPIPVNYTLKEVNQFLKSVSPSLIVADSKLILEGMVDGFAQDKVIAVGEGKNGYVPWDKVCYPYDLKESPTIAPNDIAYLNYTTGTTGSPKGAIATHINIYWNTKSSVEAMEMHQNDVHLCMFASFAHPHEIFARPLYTGSTLCLLPEINPKVIASTVQEKEVTCMMGLAPMYDMLIRHCSHFKFKTLRIAESGGMYTRPDIIQGFKKHFGIPVLSVWGSTETTGIAIANTPGNFREDGSMGQVCPYYEGKIVDEEGKELPANEIGEMIIRGKGVVSGYNEKSAQLLSDREWYYTGDLVKRSEDGFFYFVERKSGMLKIAGLKVYPLQIEIILTSHPGINEAAVVGKEDQLRGMVPKAYIVLKPEFEHLSVEEIKKFCKNKMPDYMVPRDITFLPEMPKIGSGKINKKLLL